MDRVDISKILSVQLFSHSSSRCFTKSSENNVSPQKALYKNVHSPFPPRHQTWGRDQMSTNSWKIQTQCIHVMEYYSAKWWDKLHTCYKPRAISKAAVWQRKPDAEVHTAQFWGHDILKHTKATCNDKNQISGWFWVESWLEGHFVVVETFCVLVREWGYMALYTFVRTESTVHWSVPLCTNDTSKKAIWKSLFLNVESRDSWILGHRRARKIRQLLSVFRWKQVSERRNTI